MSSAEGADGGPRFSRWVERDWAKIPKTSLRQPIVKSLSKGPQKGANVQIQAA